jgi:hypothetical protein
MADGPGRSDYTSVKQRIGMAQTEPETTEPARPKPLFRFVGYLRQDMPTGLPFRLRTTWNWLTERAEKIELTSVEVSIS